MSDLDKKSILIVDDSDDFIDVIEMILIQDGAIVERAENGEAAKKILSEKSFDLIISDYQMPKVSGAELFEWTKQNCPTPFILMTGFSDIDNNQMAEAAGLDGFLKKPFDIDDFIETVTFVAGRQNILPAESEDYLKIPIEHFFCGYKIPYRVYIKFETGGYKKVAHVGESLDNERIFKYRSKGVQFLYLKSEDFKDFVNFQLSLTKSSVASPLTDPVKRASVVSSVLSDLFVHAPFCKVDEEVWNQCVSSIDMALSVFLSNPKSVDVIEEFQGEYGEVYTHSLKVCLFSVAVAKSLGRTSSKELYALSLGALFHDVGKMSDSEHGKLFLKKAGIPVEAGLIGGHAEAGYSILSKVEGLPQQVLDIVLAHEDVYGTHQVGAELGMVTLPHIVAAVNYVFSGDSPMKVLDGSGESSKKLECIDSKLLASLKDLVRKSYGGPAELTA
mgnify:CR=1 FL=1